MTDPHKDLSAELKGLVEGNPDLKEALILGFGSQKEICPECNFQNRSHWYGKSLEDFYPFIREWQTHIPISGKAPDGEDLLGQFNGWFADYVTSQEGYLAVQHPLFRSWFIDFQNARKAFLETEESARNVDQIVRDTGIDLDDYIVPKGGYGSFVDFFTRQLKPGARHWVDRNDPAVLNSPIDATFAPTSSVLPDHPDIPSLSAKGDILSVREVFNNHPFASRFLGGTALTFWLEYDNAHWFYAPIDGVVVASGVVAGLYGIEYAYKNLPAHKRGYLLIETEKFGLIGLLFVGLQTVSEIDLMIRTGDAVAKGDPLGRFNYGGSTAIVFHEKGKAKPAIKLDSNDELTVKIGQKLLIAASPAT